MLSTIKDTHKSISFVKLQTNKDKKSMLKASKAREESSDPPVKDQNENDIGLLNSSRRS